MELRVDSSQFAPNHGGGGGGGFYQGRQQDEQKDDEQPKRRRPAAPLPRLEQDACVLPTGRRSGLTLDVTTMIAAPPEPLDLEGFDEEIHRSLRVMNLMVIRLERDLERRLRCEVGDVVVW